MCSGVASRDELKAELCEESVDGLRLVLSAQCDAVRFVGVEADSAVEPVHLGRSFAKHGHVDCGGGSKGLVSARLSLFHSRSTNTNCWVPC